MGIRLLQHRRADKEAARTPPTLMGNSRLISLDLYGYKNNQMRGRRHISAMVKTLVTIASIGSGVAVVACLFTVGYIFNDINSFHDEVIDTMTEFKVSP